MLKNKNFQKTQSKIGIKERRKKKLLKNPNLKLKKKMAKVFSFIFIQKLETSPFKKYNNKQMKDANFKPSNQ